LALHPFKNGESMSKRIKRPGGVTARVVATINGFKAKHGYWPTRIEAEAATIIALATHYLTPFGFFLVQMKVELTEGAIGTVVARGRGKDAFDYSNEESAWTDSQPFDASAWLGLED
jgi:hypothetical protein